MSEKLDLIVHAGSRTILDASDGVFLFRNQTVADWESLKSKEIDLAFEAPIRGGIDLSTLLGTPDLMPGHRLTEAMALAIMERLANTFGWAGAVYTRLDAESYVGRKLSQQEWEDITSHPGWGDVGPESDAIAYSCIQHIDSVIPDDPEDCLDESEEDWF